MKVQTDHPAQKPDWLKVQTAKETDYQQIKSMLTDLKLVTVCEEAHCPNLGECWQGGTATFMLMGDTCTRACHFCAVKTGNPHQWLDENEPWQIAEAAKRMGLSYLVLTSVDRDDLPDQGAGHFAQTISVTKRENPRILVEVLTPDFNGEQELIKKVIKAEPNIFAHNMETVRRLTPSVRDRRCGYDLSLKTLAAVKEINPNQYTKTSLMLGLGERDEEIEETLSDLRAIGVDIITFGQYLSPTKRHYPVKEFVTPEKFDHWRYRGQEMGFLYCASGALVRSSYRAGEFFVESLVRKKDSSMHQ